MHGFIARLTAYVGGLAMAMTLLTMAPAQAVTPDSQRATTSASAVPNAVDTRQVMRNLTKSDRLLIKQVMLRSGASVWEGGCKEMVGRCVFLNRQAQVYLVGGSLAFVGTLLCGSIPILGCALSAVLAYAAYEYISNRGGICGGPSPMGPWYRPTLEIRYTWIHSAKCV